MFQTLLTGGKPEYWNSSIPDFLPYLNISLISGSASHPALTTVEDRKKMLTCFLGESVALQFCFEIYWPLKVQLGFRGCLWRGNLMSIYCELLRKIDFLISNMCECWRLYGRCERVLNYIVILLLIINGICLNTTPGIESLCYT